MMSSSVTFTKLPPLPIAEINSVDDDLCLLPESERNVLLNYFKDRINTKVNKSELGQLRLPNKFTVLIHNKELYIRHRRAGKGSFGVVKFLWNVRTHEWYAMKIVSENNDGCKGIAYQTKVETLVSEHQMLHECHMAEADVGKRQSPKKGNQSYFVMPAKSGIELYVYQTEVLQNRIAHPHLALSRYKQICLILHDLHARGILHRDVKTENLILDIASNQLALVDFGCAKHLPAGKDVLVEKQLSGTIFNLAPELLYQTHDFHYSTLTDRFAVGTSIGECHYFTTTNLDKPARLYISRDFSPFESRLFVICEKLMHHDPAQRIPLDQAAAELDALHRLLDTPLMIGFVQLNQLLTSASRELDGVINILRTNCHEIVLIAPADFKITPIVYSAIHKMHLAGLRVHDKIFHQGNPHEIIEHLRELEPSIQRKISIEFPHDKSVDIRPEKPVVAALEPIPTQKAPGKLSAAPFRQFKTANATSNKAEKPRQGCFRIKKR